MTRRLILLLTLAVGLGAACRLALAEDWPHWMGPTRDNCWHERELLREFPPNGPQIVWRAEVAGGYSGPAVAEGRVLVTDYVSSANVKVPNFERKDFSGRERVLCLDEATGKQLWAHEYPVKYSISYPSGPRCTPVIDERRVYTLGAEGDLHCLDLADGRVVWSTKLRERYKTKAALWGYAAHPLIDGDRLITLAGGNGSHVVALDKRTGEEVWRSLSSSEQGYSPPTIIEAGGVRQLILLCPDAVTSLNPEDGDEYWSVPYEATSGSIIMSPVKLGDYLYVAGYSQKSLLLQLDQDAPEVAVVWQDKRREAISPVNVQPIADLESGIVYGFDQSGDLVALRIPDGKRLWSTPQPLGDRAVTSGTGFLVRQADRYWMFTETGHLVIAKMDAERFTEIDRVKVIEPTNVAMGRDVVWSMPAFANRRTYIRNDQELICVNLAAEQSR